MDKDFIRENFKRTVEELQKMGFIENYVDFSEKTGIRQPNLSAMLNGDRNVSQSMLKGLFSAFPMVSKDYIYEKKGRMFKLPNDQAAVDEYLAAENSAGLPLIPFEFVAGFGEDNIGIKLDECTVYKIPEFQNIGAEFLVRVSGNSMYPKYSSGDILACRKIPNFTFFQWGKIYVIDSPQGQIVKRVCEHEDGELIWLISDNREKLFEGNKEKYAPFAIRKDEIRSLSIVVGAVRME